LLPAEDSLAVRVADLIAGEKYSLAEESIAKFSDSLTLAYWRGALHIARWNDLRQAEDQITAKKMLTRVAFVEPDSVPDLERLYYIAQAKGQLGVELARQGSWMEAIGMSRESVDILEDIIDRDSTFTDALTGIAVYRYWIADKMPLYSWLNFRFSDKSEAVRNLEIVSRKGIYGRALALQQLFWIHINEGEFSLASGVRNKYRENYPGTRLGLWLNYFVLAYRDSSAGALSALEELERAYLNVKPLSRLNLLEIRMKQFEYCEKLNLRGRAEEIIKKIENMRPSSREKKQLKTKFERYEEILENFYRQEDNDGKNSLH
jgi:hypothetical protein